MLEIEVALPPQRLSTFVSMFYRLETSDSPFNGFERADIPHCRIHFDAPGEIRFGEGKAFPMTGNVLIGNRNRASLIKGMGAGIVFGFGILPIGWCAMVGRSAWECVDQVFDSDSMMKGVTQRIRDVLSEEQSLAEMIEAATPILEEVSRNAHDLPIWFTLAVDKWLEDTLSPKFEDLVAATGLSRNKTETMMKEIYGASPALYIRKCRALRVANRIANGVGDWYDYIDDAYYDQSHCIREIKYFTGLTPAALRSAPSVFAQAQFTRRRAVASTDA